MEQENPSFAPLSQKRRRGAPIGNTNAIKHGMYSPRHNPDIYTEESERSKQTLDEEITHLRFFMRRLYELSISVDNIYDAAGLLRVLSMASTSLTNMLRAQYLIFGDESQGSLSRALQAVLADMRAKKAGSSPPKPE